MKVLVIGSGQIGKAIHEIIKPFHDVHIRDIDDMSMDGIEVLHICYPDGIDFIENTENYIRQYKPALTIIHSSVAVETTEEINGHVVHVPVRGRHPKLAQEIPAFRLFVGGKDKEDVLKACAYLEGCGLVTKQVEGTRGTEICKLLSNIHMGLEIAWRQEVERILKQYEVSPSIYEEWEESYNLGYRITGDEHLTRPILNPGPIGGHCILQCTDILSSKYPSHVFDFIKESNEKAKRDSNIR